MATTDRPQRPRSKSNFSHKSDKSHKSQGSTSKPKESPEEKRRSHLSLNGKANPNAAINEAQPIAAALEKPTIGSLRSFTHVDAYGNSIAEPDLSNPTRPRWERPLDTIRSFEAAIDTEYKRRSMIRADTAPDPNSNFQSRRSSYYGGQNERNQRPATGGYYGNGVGAGRENYAEQNYGPPVSAAPRNRYNQRMMSDPMAARYGNGQQPLPHQAYHNSRDTVNTGMSGSGSEPWGNSTDPSSDNSSVERIAPVNRPEAGEQYGFSGFGGAPIMEEHRNDSTYSHPHGGSQIAYWPPNHPNAVAPLPPVPPKHSSNRKPIPLGPSPQQPLTSTSSNEQRARTLSKNDSGDKRKSWFKRKFSKD